MREHWEERAAILEYDGGMPRELAELHALGDLAASGLSPFDAGDLAEAPPVVAPAAEVIEPEPEADLEPAADPIPEPSKPYDEDDLWRMVAKDYSAPRNRHR